MSSDGFLLPALWFDANFPTIHNPPKTCFCWTLCASLLPLLSLKDTTRGLEVCGRFIFESDTTTFEYGYAATVHLIVSHQLLPNLISRTLTSRFSRDHIIPPLPPISRGTSSLYSLYSLYSSYSIVYVILVLLV